MCWSGTQNPNASYFSMNQGGSNPSYNTISNSYFHGWTHVSFNCGSSGGEPTGNCDGANIINGVSNNTYAQGDIIINNVFDGSDTDQVSIGGITFGGYAIVGNYFGHMGNPITTNNTHVLHDNLFEYISQSGDGHSHSNIFEFNTEFASSNAVYNNVIRQDFVGNGAGQIQQMSTGTGQTDYYFNNVVYAINSNGNYFDTCGGPGHGSGCGFDSFTLNIFNNTWVFPSAGGVSGSFPGSTVNFVNNQCIEPGGGTAANCYTKSYKGNPNYVTNVVQATTVATGLSLTASEKYAYMPAAGSGTIGTGTNEQSLCAAMLNSGDPFLAQAGTACQSDTTFACAYAISTHTMSCPARLTTPRPVSKPWDVGAYQYSTSLGPVAPVKLQTVVQ
jgi:hypothetical protein